MYFWQRLIGSSINNISANHIQDWHGSFVSCSVQSAPITSLIFDNKRVLDTLAYSRPLKVYISCFSRSYVIVEAVSRFTRQG